MRARRRGRREQEEASADRLAEEVRRVGFWFHSMDLGGGVTTPGQKPAETLRAEIDALGLPDLRGRSVLDVGAWDGFYSFEAERRGAARVVALDHYAWSVDQAAQMRYSQARVGRGEPLVAWHLVPELWQPAKLPGKAGFDLAHRQFGSRVEAVVGDFTTMDLSRLGRFDVVLFLGVLYHLEDPMGALRRLVALTAGLCVIETVCAVFPGMEDRAIWEMFDADQLDGDPSNWWAPNAAGLAAACGAAGFSEVDLVARPGEDDPPNPGYRFHYGRAIVHARA